MPRHGRPRKSGPRDKNGRRIKAEEERLVKPSEHIIAKRHLWSFVTPTKGPDGRGGDIDQDVCDGIGQLQALGLLDGHGFDGVELRDIGREWRDFYTRILRKQGFKAGGYERMDKAREREPKHEVRLDHMDLALCGIERSALMSLLVDPIIGSWADGEEEAPWVRGIIAEGLLKRNRIVKFARFPDSHDTALLAAAIRGLLVLKDASLPNRWEHRRVA